MQITDEKLDAYTNKFRGSKEEEAELLELYAKFKGNMKNVFEYLPCSDDSLDSHRFMDTIDAAVEAETAEEYSAYTKWKKKVENKKRPSDPLKPKKTENAGPSLDLVAAIQKRVCTDICQLSCNHTWSWEHSRCVCLTLPGAMFVCSYSVPMQR